MLLDLPAVDRRALRAGAEQVTVRVGVEHPRLMHRAMLLLAGRGQVTSEATWQARVDAAAEACGWLHYHTHDSRRSDLGYPDLVLCCPVTGELLHAELKVDSVTRVGAAQVPWLRALALRGEVHVWRPADLAAVADRLATRTLEPVDPPRLRGPVNERGVIL